MIRDGIREKVSADLKRHYAALLEEEQRRGILPDEQELLRRLK